MDTGPTFDQEALRRARERAGLTQHELARRVGVAGGERVSMWERGASQPRPELLPPLAAALGLTPADLLVPDLIGSDLRRLRFLAGLSSAELAEAIHLSKVTLKRWEAGHLERLPVSGTLKALAGALGVTVPAVRQAMTRSMKKASLRP
ncbi:MAG TPA: helix-turn-helix transcriptional regulator [Dermatophilaceae bacterium]|jgi:transcriptional regulator with XRE-family HTH domain